MTVQMTPLRRRMIDDMAIRNMSPNTQKIYIRAVAHFSAYHRQSPDKLGHGRRIRIGCNNSAWRLIADV